MSKEWLSMYTANYNGETPQAKELEGLLKQNYQGATYIPWATMERMVYEQDPGAAFDVYEIESKKYTLQTNTGDTETSVDFFVHMVTVTLNFMGKYFTENYPIQDNKYGAPKIIDANLANKAIQRAKAKVASRATGLGLKLYEGLDLQFEDDKEHKKEHKTKPVEVQKVEKPVQSTSEVGAFAKEIANNESFNKALDVLNGTLQKKYDFTISPEDSEAELIEKLSKLDNPAKFMETLRKRAV